MRLQGLEPWTYGLKVNSQAGDDSDATGDAADGCEQPAPDAPGDVCAMFAQQVASGGTLADPLAAELAQVAEAWPELPAVVRAGIMAMIRAAGDASV